MSIYDVGLDRNTSNYVPLTPISFLDRSAAVHPDDPAIIDGDRCITYRQMFQRCRQFADRLRRLGIARDDTVSVLSPNCTALLEAHYAVPMAGAVLNAINYRLDAPSIAFILNHGNSKALLVDSELVPQAKAALSYLGRDISVIEIEAPGWPRSSDWITYQDFIADGDPEAAIDWPTDEWQAISLNYTSGTTGNPKGIVYHHRGAYLNALGNALAVQLTADSVYLWTLPMFHCNGWSYSWAITAVGGTHICQRAIIPAQIFDRIAAHRVTHMCGAPVVLSMLAFAPEAEEFRLAHPVKIITGGAAPTSTIISRMEAMGFVVMHAYGLTETYGPATSCEWQPDWNDKPLAERARLLARQGVRSITSAGASVIDPQSGEEVPMDGQTMGEIVLRGNTVMKGYLLNPAASDAVFRDGWFRSGDLGVRHPDGYIEVKDRLKDIIISGGENISSLEVEEILARHPAVREVAVVAKPDPHWGEVPCAFIALKEGAGEVSAESVLSWCDSQMAHFKRPRHVIFGELPKTVTGKVQKYLLRQGARDI
ncbi:AMP-binding protein [Dongia soli]|uniref:AMP-binding protein n=1 Tax=Dongia soli TaxID=600628 RepID=A0ABU5EBG1_9PROT|nr:AMP-binding protein [Dongia soli]MDY0883222.1 AMP-binding protein [Dongia soli]